MNNNTINICLPKGQAMEPTAEFLEKRGFPVIEYNSKNRSYRPDVEGLPVRVKIMAEKDTALQIAVRNYDVGFCGFDWIIEHTSKYKASDIHIFKKLDIGKKNIYACASLNSNMETISDIQKKQDFVTIISEYPNIAENFAVKNRLRKFKIFSAWGSVESYPPEHADIVLIAAENTNSMQKLGLRCIKSQSKTWTIKSEICIIVNKKSFAEKDLAPVLCFF